MKVIIADNEENSKFTSVVAKQFIKSYIEYGEIPEYLSFYRSCKLVDESENRYTYSYPVSKEQVQYFTLYCPEKFIDKALFLHNEIINLQKEFVAATNKRKEEK